MEDAAALTLHEDTAPDDNILVAGAGAIGCIVAAYLGRAGVSGDANGDIGGGR